MAAAATTNDLSDGQCLPDLLNQIDENIAQISSDGAYDAHACYDAIEAGDACAGMPPRCGTRIWQHGNSNDSPLARDENLRCSRRVGHKRWKQACGYHRRSLAETTVFRVKTIFGNRLRSAALKDKPQRCLSVALR